MISTFYVGRIAPIMILGRLHHQSGIALGPILFIVAAIAILGAVIATGSGGFNANTATENAKANAETIINACGAYQNALNLLLANGCDPTQIDWTPNEGGYPTGATTWTGGNYSTGGTGHAGNGQCALFDPRGGGMVYKPFPPTALMSPATGDYTSADDGGANEDAFAGYPILFGTTCINGMGTCPLGTGSANGAIIMFVHYLNYSTCEQINKTVSISWDAKATFINPTSDYEYNVFYSAGNVRNAGAFVAASLPYGYSGVGEACAYDNNSNNRNSAYVFMCALMIR